MLLNSDPADLKIISEELYRVVEFYASMRIYGLDSLGELARDRLVRCRRVALGESAFEVFGQGDE